MNKKKIEWQGGILHSGNDTPVVIKSKAATASKANLASQNMPAKKITGRCALRLEKKGRGGNPAIIMFNFSDPEAKNLASLKQLCSELKTKLACGGTVEDGEILLTLQDMERVKKVLSTILQPQA